MRRVIDWEMGPDMSETLIRNADTVLTMDDTRRELARADILIRNGVIAEIGQGLVTTGAVVEARGYERFAMLAEGLSDPGLRETYAELARCEARHQGLYLRLARTYYAAEEVETHLDRVLDLEAALLRELPLRPALH